MGICHSKLISGYKRSSTGTRSSQSTIVENDYQEYKHMHGGTPHKDPEPKMPLPFGKTVRKEFLFDSDYRNLNHGSYGTIPEFIQEKLRHYQLLHERRPDQFIRYTYPKLLDENRAAAAAFLNAPSVDEVVFVHNATTGVNTVLRGLSETWAADGLDEILEFNTIYGACGKTIDYVVDSTHGRVSSRTIDLLYPISDADILARFTDTVRQSRAEGKRPRVLLLDTASSIPAVVFPFQAIVKACRDLGILSLVDAAQGVGMIPFDLTALDPDFFVTNCHKWLFVPRSCAIFYVATRNQHLLLSTVPTSHGYVPRGKSNSMLQSAMPLLSSEKSRFVELFAYVGTLDNSSYLCVKDAIEWRERVLGGEERIREYCNALARDGGIKVAEELGTWVLRTEEGTLRQCPMVNVALPLVVAPEADSKVRTDPVIRKVDTVIPYHDANRIWEWMTKVMVDEHQTFLPFYYYEGRFWARLCAQVYLDINDFEWAGKTIKGLCERVAKKEYDL